jgi:RNA polymerase sigma factor (sigma-70 family)
MKNRLATTLLRVVRQPSGAGAAEGLSDRELLSRFVRQQDEKALDVLVRRYGPMVHGVCRRILRHSQDIEDAFQATFIILARKAVGEPWQESIGNWLYGVALREARQLRRVRRRQVEVERELGPSRTVSPSQSALRELGEALDEEIARLPGEHRAPIVLCYLGGRTQDEAARQLGWSLRTLQRRLEAGRRLLRGRLVRRGFTVSLAGVASWLTTQSATASAPAGLLRQTAALAGTHVLHRAPLPPALARLVNAYFAGELSTRVIWMGLAAGLLLALGGLVWGLAQPDPAVLSHLSLSGKGSEAMSWNPTFRPALEVLENREVPAIVGGTLPSGVSWTYDNVANLLTIVGTPGDDRIILDDDETEGDYTILIGSYDTGVKAAKTLMIDVKLGSGNDVFFDGFDKTWSHGRLRVWGQAGNDTLQLGFMGTRGGFVDGGDGNDLVIGNLRGEAADLRGGAGDDTFFLYRGATASGGAGNDTFYFFKDSPPRRMLGGTGSDRFIGFGFATFTLDQLKAISDFNAAEDSYQL